jgi:hypothetical protein
MKGVDMESQTSLIRDKLLNGNLLKTACQLYLQEKDEQERVGKEIAFLHNEGKINAIFEFKQLTKKMDDVNFFKTLNIFEQILPLLDAPVLAVMECTKHLASAAGNDTPYNSFIKYCEANPKHPKEVLKIALDSGLEWLAFIPLAIIAGANLSLGEYISTAIDLATNQEIEIKKNAVFALGEIDYKNDSLLITNAFETLEKVIQLDYDDNLFSLALTSGWHLYITSNYLDECRVNKFIKSILPYGAPLILYKASEILAFNSNKISLELLDIFLDALKATKPQHTGTLNYIDLGLEKLLKENLGDKVILFLEDFLIQNDKLSIEVFDSIINYLHAQGLPTLCKLATRWFLSKKLPLSKAVMDIISQSHKDIILHVDINQVSSNSSTSYLFVARKAAGWLFDNQISATSFIVSLLDISPDDEKNQIAELLFNPLLMCYPGKIRKYIEMELPNLSPKTQKVVNNILSKMDDYYASIKEGCDICELLPSQAQQETYSRYCNRRIGKIYKDAEKNSILSSFCSKSIILYGRSSISYVYSGNEITRTETPLQGYEHFIEIPSLRYIDPHDFDYMIRIFKAEGCE